MKASLHQVDYRALRGRRVLVRVDFNTPLDADGRITDDTRIRASLETIEHLAGSGARVILISHLGRPKGREEKLSLKPIAAHLADLLRGKGINVSFANECVGHVAHAAVAKVLPGEVCLLENVRFHQEDEANDLGFAQRLALLGEIYVNDAFGVSHRAHASTAGLTQFLRPALAGFLLEREVNVLSSTLENPTRPFATIIGGSKVSSKMAVLEKLLERADVMIIGGAMAFSFLKAQGFEVGRSLVENDRLEYCTKLMARAKELGVRLILPVDVVCGRSVSDTCAAGIARIHKMPPDLIGLDIGPTTIRIIEHELDQCQTIMWNGPLGLFETRAFAMGTNAIIDKLVALTGSGNRRTVVGGGDSVAALSARNVTDGGVSHISTGGGATLEFIEQGTLPGIACLDDVRG